MAVMGEVSKATATCFEGAAARARTIPLQQPVVGSVRRVLLSASGRPGVRALGV